VIDEPTRKAVRQRVASDVRKHVTTVLINQAILGDVAGVFASPKQGARTRFNAIAAFLFQDCAGVLFAPFDLVGLKHRFRHEVEARGKAPHEKHLLRGRQYRWVPEAFLRGKASILHRLADDARQRKDTFVQEEQQVKQAVEVQMKAVGGAWPDAFRGWDADPHAMVDDWTLDEMKMHPGSYGLPSDRTSWPGPRGLPTLWYARAYTAARLKEIGEGRSHTERGDLYDGVYFQDGAYADILVTEDEAIHRRARSARIAIPRVMRTADWISDLSL
jgi:hypothetical protein